MPLMTLTNKYRADLLALVDRYKAVSGKADSSVSIGAFQKDFNFVSRLRKGNNFTIYKAEKLEDYVESKLEEIRHQLGPRAGSVPVSDEVFQIPQAASEPIASDRSEEGGLLTEDDGNEYRHRGFASPHGA